MTWNFILRPYEPSMLIFLYELIDNSITNAVTLKCNFYLR